MKFYQVHFVSNHTPVSAPLVSYVDALRWVREFVKHGGIALRIVRHNGEPKSPMFHYDDARN